MRKDTIHIEVCLFCFSLCISDLVLKIVGIVEIYVLNTYKKNSTFFVTYNLKFFEIVAWEHEMGGIIGYFPHISYVQNF
jgi:hypothetical protein